MQLQLWQGGWERKGFKKGNESKGFGERKRKRSPLVPVCLKLIAHKHSTGRPGVHSVWFLAKVREAETSKKKTWGILRRRARKEAKPGVRGGYPWLGTFFRIFFLLRRTYVMHNVHGWLMVGWEVKI